MWWREGGRFGIVSMLVEREETLRCQDNSGGFSATVGGAPAFSASFELLTTTNKLTESNSNIHNGMPIPSLSPSRLLTPADQTQKDDPATQAFLLAVLTAGGGLTGYIRTGSVPSVAAGMTVGALVRCPPSLRSPQATHSSKQYANRLCSMDWVASAYATANLTAWKWHCWPVWCWRGAAYRGR